jgi:endonuclease YncB( thermonuclease family)
MPRRSKPPGYEKWTWAEINAGRRMSKTEKRWNRMGKDLGWTASPGGGHEMPPAAVPFAVLFCMGFLAFAVFASVKGPAGLIALIGVLVMIPAFFLMVAFGGKDRGAKPAPAVPSPTPKPSPPPGALLSDEAKAGLRRVGRACLYAASFRWIARLPDWAQPIVWAAGATTPIAIIAALLLARGRTPDTPPAAVNQPTPVARPSSLSPSPPVAVGQAPRTTPAPQAPAPTLVAQQVPRAAPPSPAPPAEIALAPDDEAPADVTSNATPVEQVPPAGPKAESLADLKGRLSKRDFTGRQPYKVMLVPDGVSVVFKEGEGSRRVALLGIDPPESVNPGPLGKAFGRRAREFLKGLIADQDVYVECDADAPTDKDGRYLVYLYRASDGLLVNLEMLDSGYGFMDDAPSFPSREAFGRFEEDARRTKRGLWGEVTIPQSELVVEDGYATWRRTLELRRQRHASEAVADAAARQQARQRVEEIIASQPDQIFGLPPLDMSKPVYVHGYTRKDGTYVRSHTRSLPSR